MNRATNDRLGGFVAARLARTTVLSLALGIPLGGAAAADQLVPPEVVTRTRPLEATYRFDKPATGRGFLDIEWSDVDGRVVEQRHLPLDLAGASELTLPLDITRAVTMKNRIATHLSLDGVDQSGGAVHREDDEARSFVVEPSDNPWSDFQIIMWQPNSQVGYAALKRLGITAGMVESDHRAERRTYLSDELDPLLANDLRCYLENIATDFYSPYHRWSGNLPVNWKFLEVKKRYRENPLDPSALIREPSLTDRGWLQNVHDRLSRDVRALQPYRPLYYNLGDETGIADLSAFWDFDFSETSLTAMRDWLKERYGSLTALNREWASKFDRWEQVTPMTTREAMQRPDHNFSAWADFKEWMDVAFARAVTAGTEAIQQADPHAVAAIEGAQIPGWGGYDYSRLAASVDAMELYDSGDSVEIVRSFNPRLIMLLTSGGRGAFEEHRVWREVLRGIRVLILWDEKNEFVDPGGNVAERGREAAPYFAELRGGLGALLINSRRHTDPVGVLYSPASMRVQWLVDRRASRADWSRRNASTEYQDDAIRAGTRNFTRLIEHRGLQPRFVSTEELRRGELANGDYRILMLPHTIALSSIEAREIRAFVAHGGIVVADCEPGIFDEHGRRMVKPALADVFAGPPRRATPGFVFGKGRAIYTALNGERGRGSSRAVSEILEAAGVRPRFPLARTDGGPVSDVETYVFENGEATIVALLRDFLPSASPSSRETVVMTLPHPLNGYDLRTGRRLGHTDRLAVELGPVEPVVLSLSEKPLAPPSISGPRNAHLGGNAEFMIRSEAPAAVDVVHLDAFDPEGNRVGHYSGNLPVTHSCASKLLPFAVNDQPGVWTIRVRDLLSGTSEVAKLQVEP